VTVLVRAVAALKVAKDTPVCEPISKEAWADVMRSHNEMQYHLERLLAGQKVEVEA
jgi:hypothetical protein